MEHSSEYPEFIDLDTIGIPLWIIDRVPATVAREYTLIPIRHNHGCLTVVISDTDAGWYGLFDQIRFVLNQEIELAIADRRAILRAIERYYGYADRSNDAGKTGGGG